MYSTADFEIINTEGVRSQPLTRYKYINHGKWSGERKTDHANNCQILRDSDQNVLQGTWSTPFSRHLWGVQRSV